MDTDSPTEALRLLVLIQLAVSTVAAAEFLFIGMVSGGLVGPGLLTALGAGLTWRAYRTIDRRRPRARTRTRRLQYGWLALAAIDLALRLIMMRRGFPPMGTVTRLLLPIAILAMLSRPSVRSELGDDDAIDLRRFIPRRRRPRRTVVAGEAA